MMKNYDVDEQCRRGKEEERNASPKREGSYSTFDTLFLVSLSILRLWKGGLIPMEG